MIHHELPSSERRTFRPAECLFSGWTFEGAPAIQLLRNLYPSFLEPIAGSQYLDYKGLCKHVGIPWQRLISLLQGIEMQEEQEYAAGVAQAFGVPTESLFPRDVYPWLYSDDYSPAYPTYSFRAAGEVLPERTDEVEVPDADAVQSATRSKMMVSREWTRARRQLDADQTMQARQRYEQACLELVGAVLAEHPVEGQSEEEAVQEGMCSLLEALKDYERTAQIQNMVTYVRLSIENMFQKMNEERQHTEHLTAYSIERDALDDGNMRGEHPLAQAWSDEYAADVQMRNVVADLIGEPSDHAMHAALSRRISKVLRMLSYREREILKLRYGLQDGHPYTLEEVGRIFHVGIEWIRQIEARVIRKLQQPSRAGELVDFLPGREKERDNADVELDVPSPLHPMLVPAHPMVGYVHSIGEEYVRAQMWFEKGGAGDAMRLVSIPRALFPLLDLKRGQAIRWAEDNRIQFISAGEVMYSGTENSEASPASSY